MRSEIEVRLQIVKKMDEVVRNFNDEELIMTWLMVGCPDASTEEDYLWFAEDEQEYLDLVKLFGKLFHLESKWA